MKRIWFWGLTFLIVLSIPGEVWPMGRRPPLVKEEPLLTPAIRPPVTLRECYEFALQRSETVAIEKEQIKEAEAQFFKAASEALGDIDFVMEHKRQDIQKGGGSDGAVATSSADPDRRERKFTFSQPLFRGFKSIGALAGAGSLKKEQKEEWLRAKQLLFLDVVEAFYGLLRQKKDLDAVEEIHRLLEERIRDLAERELIGRSRQSEVVTARARLKSVEAERSRARGEHAVAQLVLEFLTGLDLASRELVEEDAPEAAADPLDRYLASVEGRPDVEAARQSMKTSRQGVIVAQSAFWPEITIEHNQYERREGFLSNLDWDFLFKINVPLFRGGETVGKVKEARSLWRQEKLNHSFVLREAELEIKTAYQYWIASLEEVRALEEATESSRENFQLQREEYQRNLVSNLEVLEALESLHETRREANQAYHRMKINFWNLWIAAGEIP